MYLNFIWQFIKIIIQYILGIIYRYRYGIDEEYLEVGDFGPLLFRKF